ncbi:MAG: FkbM family methyltransferase [Alphaproteobacteria bacterium]|nr:FkbM family methyltransferase [Alphaproteobacteria bacterium]
MSDFFESHSEDQARRLAALVRRLAEREIGAAEVAPVEGWQMGKPAVDANQGLRAQLWESMKDFQEDCFPIRLPWMDGTTLEFGHANETGRQIYVNRSFDPNDIAVLGHFLKAGATFVDVGANAGVYSVYGAKRVGPKGHVFAFEPSRREAASLNRNADINRLTNLRCFQMAAGAEEGIAALSVADAEFDGHNSLAGLALARTYPNLRYTVDNKDYRWTSFTGRSTQIALGKASQLEILIYSESAFDFILEDILVGPDGVVTGPWLHKEAHESAARVPSQVKVDFSGAAISSFGDVSLKSVRGALRIECNSAGGVAFRWQLDPTQGSLATVQGLPRAERAREQYTVDVVSLDSIFLKPEMPKVDVIKIDVEGFEIEVLKGASRLISEQRPLILIEIVNDLLQTQKSSAAEIAEMLHRHGYILFDAAKGKPRLVDLNGDHASNIFAVPEALLDQMLKLGGLNRSALTAGLANPGPNDGERADPAPA